MSCDSTALKWISEDEQHIKSNASYRIAPGSPLSVIVVRFLLTECRHAVIEPEIVGQPPPDLPLLSWRRQSARLTVPYRSNATQPLELHIASSANMATRKDMRRLDLGK